MHSNLASGFKPRPTTSLQWLTEWTLTKSIEAPSRSGGIVTIELADIQSVDPGTVFGDPDLKVRTKKGSCFYILFPRSMVFHQMDLPLLVYPPERPMGAFWIVPRKSPV